jgi:N utilization substance protein B
MKEHNDPRHTTRAMVLQKLFTDQFDADLKDNPSYLHLEEGDISELNDENEYIQEMFTQLYNGVNENTDKIDDLIKEHAPQWPITQIKKIDLQILRIAVFEGFVSKSVPPKVAIDEAIELAKEFGGENSAKFVNGVLGGIYEEIANTSTEKIKDKKEKK